MIKILENTLWWLAGMLTGLGIGIQITLFYWKRFTRVKLSGHENLVIGDIYIHNSDKDDHYINISKKRK